MLIIYITYSCSLGICLRSIHIYIYTFRRNDCRSHHLNMYQLYSACNLSYNLLMSTNIRSNYCFGLWLEPCAYCSSGILSYYLFLHGYIHSGCHSQGNMQSNNHLYRLKLEISDEFPPRLKILYRKYIIIIIISDMLPSGSSGWGVGSIGAGILANSVNAF